MTVSQDLYSAVQDAVVELFTLDATSRGQGLLRFCAGTNIMGNAVIYNGNTFTAMPITGDGWARTTGDSAPRPTLTISNVNSVIQSLVYSAGDLSGSTLTRQRIYSKYLDQGNFPRWNLLNYSQGFDNAAWTKLNASVTGDTTTAPDGSTTADKLIENTTASVAHRLSQSLSLTSGTTYTLTVYLKAAGRTVGYLALPAAAFGGASTGAYFDLSAVTTTNFGTATATITAVGSGWYQCSVTATATVTATDIVGIYTAVGTSTTYTGDGTSGLYLWGAQLEVGSAFTTYQLIVNNSWWFTSDPSQLLSTDTYVVDRMVTLDKVAAVFELCWQLDRPGVRLPGRLALRDLGFPGLGLNAP